MSVEKVKAYLKSFGVEEKVKVLQESSATVLEAAHAIGCLPAQIAKSISIEGKEGTILIVAAGDVKIDNKKFKDTFGIKPRMLKANQVEERIGYPVGGVCPFGVLDEVEVYLDVSLKRFSLVYPAAGSANSVIPLSLEELFKYGKATAWVDVCKPN
ncbi:MAG TPA: YbaK/EbsC family protein [Candidatus Dorea intestinavium]|nr:YbaK/EbsC family protein [Candidatus Dorea intestinavium]